MIHIPQTVAGTSFLATIFAAFLLLFNIQAFSADDVAFVQLEQERGLPVRGQHSKAVITQFGEPDTKGLAVGEPPIRRWVYSDFVVYFEHDLVITSVSNQDKLPVKLHDIQ